MKKIFVFILLSLCFRVIYAQDTTLSDRVYYLWEDYFDEHFYGSIAAAEAKEEKMDRATTLNQTMLWAIGEGNTTLATNCLNALNTMFGTSHGLPSVDFTQTSQSYLDLDSLRLMGMDDYVDRVFDSTGIIAIINANIATDTAFIESKINAALDTISIDSTWEEITADIINVGSTNAGFSATGSDWLQFKSTGANRWLMAGYAFQSWDGDGQMLPAVSTNPIRFLPNRGDDDTGYSWDSADKLVMEAGGVETVTIEEAGGYTTTDITGTLVSDTVDSRAYVDSSSTVKAWLLGDEYLPADTTLYGLTPTGEISVSLVDVTENSTALIYDPSASPPDAPNNYMFFWTDSDDSKVYLGIDIAGTQSYVEMNATP